MKVIVARTAGFCMGVRRALALTLKAVREPGGPLFTHGPLIHNKQVVGYLESLGVRVLGDGELPPEGRVVVRAHGIPREERAALEGRGLEVIDATCPRVRRSERFVEEHAARGSSVIIVGDRGHAEVRALLSRARPGRSVVVGTEEEALAVEVSPPVAALAQTTFSLERWRRVRDLLRRRYPDLEWLEAVCPATRDRQEEVRRLAAAAEAVVVVGDRASANTRRLAEIAAESGRPVFHVETAAELPLERLRDLGKVAVTAGASTPGWIIDEVVRRLRGTGSPLYRLAVGLAAVGLPVALLGAAASAVTQWFLGGCSLPAFLYVLGLMPAAYNYNRYMTGRWPLAGARSAAGRAVLAAAAAGVLLALAAAAMVFAAGRLVVGFLMLGLLAASLAYPWKLVPAGGRRLGLQDIPAAKDFFVTLAWLGAAWLLPCLLVSGTVPPRALPAAFFVGYFGFLQSVSADLRNIEDDRLLGRETLASLLGRRALVWLLAVAGASSFAAAAVTALLCR